jgi:hypothetical protein
MIQSILIRQSFFFGARYSFTSKRALRETRDEGRSGLFQFGLSHKGTFEALGSKCVEPKDITSSKQRTITDLTLSIFVFDREFNRISSK